MSEIPKAYEPQSVEDRWYDFWLKQGCFTADPARVSEKRPAYSIVIPPPNVTGMLHMGHVLNNTIQDILARKAHMDGKEVLWLPGTDHAGIATEGMVSKQIWKDEKKTKRDIGREEFIKRVWTWKEKHGGIIIAQLKKLGCSCDWTRERFTMDEHYVACVKKVFVELYKQGLIYRGKRMVNWCPATQTALSDEEVEMKPQKGFMYHFKVQVVDATPSSHGEEAATPSSPAHAASGGARATLGDEGVTSTGIWLTIATTRPETIPGDTAVAVNPKDPRYAHLIGKHIIRPLPAELPREQKLIPIIGDEHVDFEFGTGVLKVTPAHDKADFEIYARYTHRRVLQQLDLPSMEGPVEVIGPSGLMTEKAGVDLVNMDRFAARKVSVEKLREVGALTEEKPYENNVGFSQRADVPIEPRLSEQWFLKYPSVSESKACVAEGRMKFHPDRWAKVYDHWLANIQDWCISRQLWWGHRIPVWSRSIQLGSLNWEKQLAALGVLEFFHRSDSQVKADTSLVVRFTRLGDNKTFDASRNQLVFAVPGQLPEDFHIVVCTTNEALGRRLESHGFTQDPDVLDTWFSSWLWPFATLGWPEQTETLKKFYPTTDLATGPDIIFFWVARMIMAGYEFMGDLPFHNVYFTGIIRDKQGRKMSKTLGNSPDPLELIAKYGADALRFGTMRSAPLGQDVLFDEKDVELGRNFCNKLWNACRFRQIQGSAGGPPAASGDSPDAFGIEGEIDPALLTGDDKWILLKLDEAIREITDAFAEYRFSDATATLYRFFWSEYCDWYVEASKAVLGKPTPDPSQEGNRAEATAEPLPSTGGAGGGSALRANKLAVIDFVLSHTLRLFHPFLPFITEELWQGMGYSHDLPEDQGGKTIMFARWPKPLSDDEKAHYGLDEATLKFVDAKYELVTRGRNLRREFNIPANKRVKFILKVKDPLAPQEAGVIQLLLNAEALDVDPNFTPRKGTPSTLTDLGELFLPLEGLVDAEAEKARLTRELAKIEGEIEKVRSKLNNKSFVVKAPPNVLEEHKKRLADWQAKQQQVKAALSALGGR